MTYAGKFLAGASSAPRNVRFALWMWVLLFAIAGPAFQKAYGQTTGLTGTVSDPSGAVVPGAQVAFTNEATGITTQFATLSGGVYNVQLAAGTYDIAVKATGFEKFVATHVAVEVGATPTFNMKLKVGSSSETVQVTSEGALELDTTNPQLDSILPSVEVTDLPLLINGYMRQITSFATLAPGVRSGSYGTVTVEGGAPSQINSSGNYYNGLQIDTASNANSNPPYEMVDQFRVIRNLFSARYGMVQGAVDYGMREGTNKLHGDGFLIDRNQFFDSDGFFPVYNGQGKPIPPANIQTEWGATVGGPVVLPKLYNGHNKTFFLFSFDIYPLEAGSDGVRLSSNDGRGWRRLHQIRQLQRRTDSDLRSADRPAVHGMRRHSAQRHLSQPHRPAVEDASTVHSRSHPRRDGHQLRPPEQRGPGDPIPHHPEQGMGRHN